MIILEQRGSKFRAINIFKLNVHMISVQRRLSTVSSMCSQRNDRQADPFLVARAKINAQNAASHRHNKRHQMNYSRCDVAVIFIMCNPCAILCVPFVLQHFSAGQMLCRIHVIYSHVVYETSVCVVHVCRCHEQHENRSRFIVRRRKWLKFQKIVYDTCVFHTLLSWRRHHGRVYTHRLAFA